mgnify:FL=1
MAVDINPHYIAATGKRYDGKFNRLELVCEDFLTSRCAFEPVDVVFAGLVFEYADYVEGLSSIQTLLKPGGFLAAVLQLPSETISAVSPTPYVSLNKLEGLFRFVPPADVVHAANSIGLRLQTSKRSKLHSGKTFQELLFKKDEGETGPAT